MPAHYRQTAMAVRRVARRLELRSVGLTPEQFTVQDGFRAALAVAVPLAIAVLSGHGWLGWAVYAAFWTCLCDSSSPDRLRRGLLGIFVVFGAVIAFAGAWSASLGWAAVMVAGPSLVFASILATAAVPYGGLAGTLLAVVAVVAVGFPADWEQAARQAFAFLGGAAWAYLLINLLWRLDALIPLRQAGLAAVARLTDMTDDLIALKGPHRDERWHSEFAEHRRAVRLALERLRGVLGRYADQPRAVIEPHERVLDATETIFNALIALDHASINHIGSHVERRSVARAFRIALLGVKLSLSAGPARSALRNGQPREAMLRRGIMRLAQRRQRLEDDLMRGCLAALEDALRVLVGDRPPLGSHPPAPAHGLRRWFGSVRPGFRPALRQSAGLVAVYVTAELFHLGYPYWASMAVVVVLQGSARMTWTRALERIVGSLIGGMAALMVLRLGMGSALLSGVAILLSGTAIALRTVNYTIFVVFLTMLFIIVTEMLMPGLGIASARMLDNVIGSVAALMSVLVLWPDLGPSLQARTGRALEINRAYLEAVMGGSSEAAIYEARRAAGLASIDVETARHGLGRLLQGGYRMAAADGAAQQNLRQVAGEAAAAWHRRLAAHS